jgi:hypothetical protein
MPDVKLFAADGSQVVRGPNTSVELAMGQGVAIMANGQVGKPEGPPEIRPPLKTAELSATFDAETAAFRFDEPPASPPEAEDVIVVDAPTSGELDVSALRELVTTAQARDSDLIVFMKRHG